MRLVFDVISSHSSFTFPIEFLTIGPRGWRVD